MATNYNLNTINSQDQIIQAKDNGVFSAWNYSSKAVGGKRMKKRGGGKSTRRYKRGKIGKGRRTRRNNRF